MEESFKQQTDRAALTPPSEFYAFMVKSVGIDYYLGDKKLYKFIVFEKGFRASDIPDIKKGLTELTAKPGTCTAEINKKIREIEGYNRKVNEIL